MLSRSMAALLAQVDKLILYLILAVGVPIIRLLRRAQAASLSRREVLPSRAPVIYFESCGLFLPYHIGVAEYIKEHFECGNVTCVGVSGGYAPAASIVLGLSPEQHFAAIEGMRTRGSQRALGYIGPQGHWGLNFSTRGSKQNFKKNVA